MLVVDQGTIDALHPLVFCALISPRRKGGETMTVVADKVFNEALSLPSDARMSLVEKLLTSLNLPTHADIDLLWAEEAERRVFQIDQGDAALISGDEVFAKIRRKYQR